MAHFPIRQEQHEHQGHSYWVTVDEVVNELTGEVSYITYVNDEEPNDLFYGTSAKNEKGETMLFQTVHAALVNANSIKQAEINADNIDENSSPFI